MNRFEKKYQNLIGELYVLDGEDFITAAEAEMYLPADCCRFNFSTDFPTLKISIVLPCYFNGIAIFIYFPT